MCRVPHLGTLTAVWNGSRIDFHLTNANGGSLDRVFSDVGIADRQAIESGDDLLGLGGQSNDELDVQLAWGGGRAAHFVRLTISWYLPTGSPHVLVFGYAR